MERTTKVFLVLAIIMTLLFCTWAGVRIYKGTRVSLDCMSYIKRAADASTIEIAKDELKKAIEYAEKNKLTEGVVSIFLNDPANDLGYWYKNMKGSLDRLENMPENSSELEITNVLMKLKESLTDSSDSGSSVTHPNGISIYPYNVAYFIWGLLSCVLAVVFWILFFCYWLY